MPSIISVGDLILDLVMKVPSLPKPEGLTLASKVRKELGGSSNFCVMASRLGLDTYLLEVVGKDSFGKFLKEGLGAEGIKEKSKKNLGIRNTQLF